MAKRSLPAIQIARLAKGDDLPAGEPDAHNHGGVWEPYSAEGVRLPVWRGIKGGIARLRPNRPSVESTVLAIDIDEAARLPIADIASRLWDWLSSPVVREITDAPDTKSVRRWASGEVRPSPERERVLRFVYQLSMIVNHRDGKSKQNEHSTRVWFETYNAYLNTTPINVLRDRSWDHSRNALMQAARSFAGV